MVVNTMDELYDDKSRQGAGKKNTVMSFLLSVLQAAGSFGRTLTLDLFRDVWKDYLKGMSPATFLIRIFHGIPGGSDLLGLGVVGLCVAALLYGGLGGFFPYHSSGSIEIGGLCLGMDIEKAAELINEKYRDAFCDTTDDSGNRCDEIAVTAASGGYRITNILGRITAAPDRKVDRLELPHSVAVILLHAEEMSPQDFAQTFVNSYEISEMEVARSGGQYVWYCELPDNVRVEIPQSSLAVNLRKIVAPAGSKEVDEGRAAKKKYDGELITAYRDGTNNAVFTDPGFDPALNEIVMGLNLQEVIEMQGQLGKALVVVDDVLYIGGSRGVYAVDIQKKRKKWFFPTGGNVFATPVVLNKMVYFGSDDKNFYAIDRKTGKEKWRFTAQDKIRETALVSGKILVFYDEEGRIYALKSKNGKELWNFDAGHYLSEELCLSDGKIYFFVPKEQLYCLNIKDGQLVYKVQIDGARRQDGAIVAKNGVLYLVAGNLYSINQETGKEIWRYASGGGSAAVVKGDVLYLAGSRKLTAININTSQEIWSNNLWKGGADIKPVIINDSIVTGSGEKGVFTLDLATGQIEGHFKPIGARAATAVYPYNGILYFSDRKNYVYGIGHSDISPDVAVQESSEGTMYREDLARTGFSKEKGPRALNKLIWKYKTEGKIKSTPVVSEGVVYFGSDDNKFYALNTSTGEELWKFESGGPVTASPVVAGDLVIFGSYDHYLYALDRKTGVERWRYYCLGRVVAAPLVEDGTVYWQDELGNIYSLDSSYRSGKSIIKDGMENWVARKGSYAGGTNTHLALSGDKLFAVKHVRTSGHEFFAHSKVDGSLLFQSGGKVGDDRWLISSNSDYNSPVVVGNSVVMGSYSDYLISADVNTFTKKKLYHDGLVSYGDKTISFAHNSLFVSASERNGNYDGVYQLSPDLKKVTGRYLIGKWGDVSGAPTITDSAVYFGDSKGNVYAYDLKSKELLWKFVTQKAVSTSPIVKDGVCFITSTDGFIYAIQ